jgi:hypothetical protein
LRQDDLWCGFLPRGRYLATSKDSKQHNEAFVCHKISLPSDSCLPPRRRRNGIRPASRFLLRSPWIKDQDFPLRGTGLL